MELLDAWRVSSIDGPAFASTRRRRVSWAMPRDTIIVEVSGVPRAEVDHDADGEAAFHFSLFIAAEPSRWFAFYLLRARVVESASCILILCRTFVRYWWFDTFSLSTRSRAMFDFKVRNYGRLVRCPCLKRRFSYLARPARRYRRSGDICSILIIIFAYYTRQAGRALFDFFAAANTTSPPPRRHATLTGSIRS